ncbi:hypothetical protein MLD38_015422 [Melastoma candidum]|uniref:Uncharacterized protein n=1 Tax=Melastoma candidum TaxID=119954 RepID=A0ACB9RGN2_9MYRT|nr:hypothetical protein MLD38_015422 [Melastoma candidum]
MEPSTQVDQIPTDPDSVSEKNSEEKCKHFSMRKYVFEMRQKDALKCWPFNMDNILSQVPKDVLPPLDVPKYRWWRCPHCLPEFWATATDTENGAISNTSCGKCKFTGPFADAMTPSETATVASNFQLMLNLDIADVKESNPCTSPQISPTRGDTSVLRVVDKGDDIVQNHSEIAKDVEANDGKGEPADIFETRGSNFREFPSLGYKSTGGLTVANAENDSETVEVENKDIDGKATEACQNEGAGVLDNFVRGENGVAPAEPDLRDSPSSDSSEVGPYMTGGLRRRKARKVRLLTDLLAAVDDTGNKHIRKDNAPLLAICDVTQEMRHQIVAEEEMENRENIKKAGLKRKRKLACEDSIKCSEGVPEIQEEGNPAALSAIAKNGDVLDSQLEDNRFPRIHSHNSKKNNLPEHHVDEATNPVRKKKKKNKVNVDSCEMKLIGAETKYTCTSSNAIEDREDGIVLSSALEIRKNTCFLKDKTDLPPIQPNQVPVIPQDIRTCLDDNPLARMDNKAGGNHPASDQLWSAKPSSAVNGAYLLSKTSSNAPSEADRPASDMRGGYSFHDMEEDPSRHGSDAFWSIGVHGLLNDGIDHKISFLSDRQRYTSTILDSRCLWAQNPGISGATKKKKSVKHKENTTALSQHHGKSADPGNPDDIPMEIVELMAKNQFERCLQDAEMDNNRRGANLLHEESSRKMKFPENVHYNVASKDFRPSAQKSFDTFSDLGASNYKMSQLERYHNPPVHHTFFQDQGLPLKFQPIGGSSLANTPKSMMKEDYSRIKASDGNFLSLGVSGTWYPPKHNEALVPCLSSMRPDCMPFGYGIMPQSFGLHSNGIDFQPHGPKTPPKAEMNCSRDTKIFPLRANCLQMAEKEFNFEAYRGATKHPYNSRPNEADYEHMAAPLDISSNETIPAMHLLSLMDAHSGKKIGDEEAWLAKRPSLTCKCHLKEGCGLHLGMCKGNIPLRHPPFDYDQAKVLPAFSPSASSSLPTNLFRAGSDDKSYVPLDVNDKGKGKCFEIGRPIGKSRVLSFLADSAGLATSYGFKPYHSTERNVPSSSEARFILPYVRMSERGTNEAHNGIHVIQPPRSGSDAAICTLNRNPAEFSVPEEGNVYSIGRDDLKLVKRVRNKPESSQARCRVGKKMVKEKRAAGGRQNQPQIA